ncbi:MAG: hypothetical protein JSW27_25510 [Phycisphaerales bacterium]|nr:MAG: hypothetical protein JSW27_25510 [Phycisphaerales bacterium]
MPKVRAIPTAMRSRTHGCTIRSPAHTEGQSLPEPRAQQTRVQIPADATGKTIHIVLSVTDDDTPPLTRYRRIIIEVVTE